MKRCHVWTLGVFVLATGSVAAQAEVVMAFGEHTYHLDANATGGNAGFTRFMTVDAVSIGAVEGAARVVLELALPPRARQGDQPHDARIMYQPQGWRDYWSSPPDFPEGGVVVSRLDLSGHTPRIAGHFDVPLCFTKSPTHTPDLTQCQPATGHFDIALTPD